VGDLMAKAEIRTLETARALNLSAQSVTVVPMLTPAAAADY